MKRILSPFILLTFCTMLNGQNVREAYYQTWKKRVDTDGTVPVKERQYVYEDKIKAWWVQSPLIAEGYKWEDAVISIKEVWVTKPEGNSQWFARITTKNAGGPFYVEYDPLSPNWGVWFFVVPDLFPPIFQKWLTSTNAEAEKKEELAKKEKENAEELAAKNIALKQQMYETAFKLGWNKTCRLSLDYLSKKFWNKMGIVASEAIKNVRNSEAINAINKVPDNYKTACLNLFDSIKVNEGKDLRTFFNDNYLPKNYDRNTSLYNWELAADQCFKQLTLKYFDDLYNSFAELIYDVEKAYKVTPSELYLEKNKTKVGVITTTSGLQYEVIKIGKGAKPTFEQSVRVIYSIALIDGTVVKPFDRKNPDESPINEVALSGLAEAFQLMQVGSIFKFYIPQELAFKEEGASNGLIPPLSAIIVEVELLKILK
jgi:FKBP-type peptidyl-prolyl cis-trans isomerase